MKGKINGNKIKGILLIAALLISVFAVAVSALEQPDYYTPQEDGKGLVTWSDENQNSGSHSMKLELPTPVEYNENSKDEARVKFDYSNTLNSLSTISFYGSLDASIWRLFGAVGQTDPGFCAPYVTFSMDRDGEDGADAWVVVAIQSTYYAALDTWYGVTVDDNTDIRVASTKIGDAWDVGPKETIKLSALKEREVITDKTWGECEVLEVKVGIGNTDAQKLLDLNQIESAQLSNPIIAFVDDVTINGVLYSFEEAGDPVDVIVTGDGSVYVPDAGTEVDYTGAVDETITIQDLAVDDVEEATFSAAGEYVDVMLEADTAITELEIRVDYDPNALFALGLTESELVLYWYDTTDWVVCSDTGVNADDDYVWAKIRADTVPSLSEMTGSIFGPGGGLMFDSAYYQTDETVTIMLGASAENQDPDAVDIVGVFVSSDSDVLGTTIGLVETGVDTGEFIGTFDLVGDTPGTGEILVNNGDQVTVEYPNHTAPSHSYTAEIDDTDPIVEIDLTSETVVSDISYEAGNAGLEATSTEANPFDLVFQANGKLIVEIAGTIGTDTTDAIVWNTLDELLTVALWPDGVYTITVTAIDGAGNTDSDSVTLTVDNSGPAVTDNISSPSIIGMGIPTDIVLTATVVDAGIGVDAAIDSVTVDLSSIGAGTENMAKVVTTDDEYAVMVAGVDIDTEDVYKLMITATDTLGNVNDLDFIEVEVINDLEGPTGLTFTEAEAICGGLIIKGLTATDPLTGVVYYDILMNGTTWLDVTEAALTATSWTSGDVVFNNMVVLDGYPGDYVNITVIAYDQVDNPSVEVILYEGTIPEGTWAPVSLYTGWNLVSLPLIPDSSDSGDIMSLILDQGASGVVVSYGYDHAGDAWITNPADMTDGYGYWLYMLADDVMIVEGIETLPAPSSPQTYEYTKGWVLAGYKQLDPSNVTDYCTSFETASYFTTVYVWDAITPKWLTPSDLSPGQGFWLFLYSDQSLIAPLED